MPSYAITGQLSGSNYVTVKAGSTYAIRLLRIEVGTGAAYSGLVYKYINGGALTGGTNFTPLAMREGGPASTASGRTGVTAISGTGILISFTPGASATYQPPDAVILPAGSSSVLAATSGTNGFVTIYFEELRLAYSR